jgi:hypothetical protein
MINNAKLRKTLGIASLVLALSLNMQPAYTQRAYDNFIASKSCQQQASDEAIDLRQYRNHYVLKKNLKNFYRTTLEQDMVYGNTLLLKKGAFINYSRYCKLVNYYYNKNGLFEDNDGRVIPKIEGFNCYCKRY